MSRERSRRRIWVIGVTLAVMAVPAALAFASHGEGEGFEDVPESNIFHDDIQWMHDNGVTRGCNPPDNDEYCPTDFLTRQQEAAFFHRYDEFLRGSIEVRLVPADCEAGQIAEFDGTAWQCADTPVADPGLNAVLGDPVNVEAGATGMTAEAICADGEIALAGGINPTNEDLTVTTSLDGATATMTIDSTAAEDILVTPHAICASA